MELMIVAILAVALGVLATVLLAVCLPADVHERAREHGRFAHLGDADERAETVEHVANSIDEAPRMSAYQGSGDARPRRARAHYHAAAMREALRRRTRRHDRHRDFVA
jgi:hypothetical protein